MTSDYTQYRAPQFAADPFFLQWRIFRDKKSSLFWETFVREHPEQEKEIQKAIRITESIRIDNYAFSVKEKEQLFRRILDSGKRLRLKKHLRIMVSSVAAGLALLVSLILLLPSEEGDRLPMEVSESVGSVEQENIRLIIAGQKAVELDNNTNVVYRTEGSVHIKNGQTGEKVLEKPVHGSSGMNTLIVPYGKRTLLTLPDRTQIWLNAGSKVEFPSQFADGKREIYAEGEIYLEVAKDSASPFIVHTPFYKVRVLGTSFNISAYRTESEHAVVLAEGTVEVELRNSESYRLSPDHKLMVGNHGVEITEVSAYEYICWKDGILQFSQETLSVVLNRIARYYGVEIDYRSAKEELFTGKLVLFEDVRTVLDNIAVVFPFTYTIDDHRIQISR